MTKDVPEDNEFEQIDASFFEITPDEEAAADAAIDAADWDEEQPKYPFHPEEGNAAQHSNPYLIKNPLPVYPPLDPDSELKKPWKEMNPLFAIEEAKNLPLPVREYSTSPEGVAAEALRRGFAVGTQEYAALEESMNRPFVSVDPLFARCPMCRRGALRSKDGYRTCPCCRGFIVVPETTILGFMASLNEISEAQRIDKSMKEIVKARKEKKKREAKPKDHMTAKEKRAARKEHFNENNIFGGTNE
jgi:hypothetical protein